MDVNSEWMLNIVVDFVEVTWADMSANVYLNINANRAKAEVARDAVDVRRNIEPVSDSRLYSVGKVDMSGSRDS